MTTRELYQLYCYIQSRWVYGMLEFLTTPDTRVIQNRIFFDPPF